MKTREPEIDLFVRKARRVAEHIDRSSEARLAIRLQYGIGSAQLKAYDKEAFLERSRVERDVWEK
jgi:hypothetical protein